MADLNTRSRSGAMGEEERNERDRKLLLAHVVVDQQTGCWLWRGKKIKGYGYCQRGGGRKGLKHYVSAHRLSHQVFKGEIPEGLVVDHLCMNTGCINPQHLQAITQAENTRRFWEHRKRTGGKPSKAKKRKPQQHKKAA